MFSTTMNSSKTGPAYNTRARQPIKRSARELYAEGEALESCAKRPKPSSSPAQAAPTPYNTATATQPPTLDQIKAMMLTWIDACDKATAANKRDDRPHMGELSMAAVFLLEAKMAGPSRMPEHLRAPVAGILEAIWMVGWRYCIDVVSWVPCHDLGTDLLRERVMNWNTGLRLRLRGIRSTPAIKVEPED
ncbi:hypothetical protein W97_07489 [Coniosporium apollinis CBS 100218]|uniref:Uncharacterized protein n=1 Tax=Coniosporium apollinis (strain CBS 100218) TaxID=1168221 RepID=R7Z2T5_CONA1|nr:uncharacterized protein W97_07489 [Coniosporium apollinis CBS 100218]EON68231.1 hypothetical protein W97_07489 [Coniosporium apollinis CBS 100218]